jgi:hypothetical protein
MAARQRRNTQQDFLSGSYDSDDDDIPRAGKNTSQNYVTPNNVGTALTGAAIGTAQASKPSATEDPLTSEITPNNIEDPDKAQGADAVVTKDNITTGSDDGGNQINNNDTKKSGSGGFIRNLLTLGAIGGLIYLVYWVIEELGDGDDEDNGSGSPSPCVSPCINPGNGDKDEVDEETEESAKKIRGLEMLGIIVPSIFIGLVLSWFYTRGGFSFLPLAVIRAGIMLSLVIFASGLFALGYTQFLAGYTQAGNIFYFFAGGIVLWCTQAVTIFSPILDPFRDNFAFFATQNLLVLSNILWVGFASRLVILEGDSQVTNVIVAVVSLFLLLLTAIVRIRRYAVHKTIAEQIRENLFESSDISLEAIRRAGFEATPKQISDMRKQIKKERKEARFNKFASKYVVNQKKKKDKTKKRKKKKSDAQLRERKELVENVKTKLGFEIEMGKDDFNEDEVIGRLRKLTGENGLTSSEKDEIVKDLENEENGVDIRKILDKLSEPVEDEYQENEPKNEPEPDAANKFQLTYLKFSNKLAFLSDAIQKENDRYKKELKKMRNDDGNRIYSDNEIEQIVAENLKENQEVLDIYKDKAQKIIVDGNIDNVTKDVKKRILEETEEAINEQTEGKTDETASELKRLAFLGLKDKIESGKNNFWKTGFWSSFKSAVDQTEKDVTEEENIKNRITELEVENRDTIEDEDTFARTESNFKKEILSKYKEITLKALEELNKPKEALSEAWKEANWKNAISDMEKKLNGEIAEIVKGIEKTATKKEKLKEARDKDEIQAKEEALESYRNFIV